MIHHADPKTDVLIATAKNGIVNAYNATTGATVWTSGTIAAGGFAQFGSCSNQVYYCVALFWYATQAKAVVACMDVRTGARKFTWTRYSNEQNYNGGVFGPLTCTQNYVFVPLFDKAGSLVALDFNGEPRLLSRSAPASVMPVGHT